MTVPKSKANQSKSKANQSKSKTKATKTKGGLGTEDMTSLIDLTPEEVKGLAKPRDKFEEQLEPLLKLAERYPQDLGSSVFSAAELRARLARYLELGPEQEHSQAAADAANKHAEMVSETRALQASTVWRGMMDLYGKAQVAGRSNKDIQKGIEAFMKFMSTGPRKKTEPGK